MPRVTPAHPKWESNAAFARDVHGHAVDLGLSALSAAILTAQCAHETANPDTGRWGDNAFGYAMTGVKASAWWQANRDWYSADTKECVPCKDGEPESPECEPGHRLVRVEGARWRAYSSLRDGVAGTLGLLDAKRYDAARAALRAEDPWYYVLVGEAGWYTAGRELYLWRCSQHLATVCDAVGVEPPLAARLTRPGDRADILRELGHGSVLEMQQKLLGFTGRDADNDYGKATHFALLRLLRGPGAV